MPPAAAATVTVRSYTARRPPPGLAPIDVEELLGWTYRRQKAHLICGQGRGLHELEAAADGVVLQGGSSASAVARILALGTMVDQSAPDPGQLHPDAEAVHRVVEQLDHRTRGLPLAWLLIQHARQGGRPDAMVGELPRPAPMLTLRGRIHVEWTDAGRRCGHCPLVYEPSATRILQAREEYAAWHRGLRLVALALQGARLSSWRVLAPAAPARPWETERLTESH